ncbi:hypothetical protein CKO12_09240 [Chromatium okenii]|uniref:hypothetical protein n=1 Tax=Chromatium okenii TaxID=61644 RepID=UPI001908A307|nr:hypothetical protein [Chromatium okenii]MBK1642054.1 hypothetical protein [Chromatium okenii]
MPTSHVDSDLALVSADWWPPTAARLTVYLAALGVTDAAEVAQLTEQVRQQVASRAAAAPLEDTIEAAIEATLALLDAWLLTELGEADPNALAAARAAVLSGEVPGWTQRWLDGAAAESDTLAPQLRALQLTAVPPLAPLPMPTSTIDLCCQRARRQFSGAICRWFCQPDARVPAPGESA